MYLGLMEDDEYDDYGYDDHMDHGEDFADLTDHGAAPRAEERARPAPTRSARRSEPEPARGRTAVVRAMPTSGSGTPRFHLVMPSSFNDAQEFGDKFREGYSVLMNLQAVDPDLARRLVDFASGLAYGLAGSMQPVADKVFLITPAGVTVSAEERRRFLEERGFFNQA